MISFFPTSYPDELLYSLMARYYAWSAHISAKATLEELFGKTTVVATFDLPSSIRSFVQNLPLGSKYTAEGLIKHHTLYPLYAPFLPPDRAEMVYESMLGHFFGDIHTRTGIIASAVPQIKCFRFCSVCLREDLEQYGEYYWHRLHQIPGVLVCATHGIYLQNSTVKVCGDNRHEFYAADADNCIGKPTIVNYTKSTLDKLTNLAQDISFVISRFFAPKSDDWFRKRYQSLLIDKELATASGRVFQKDLVREFISFYGTDFLSLVHAEIDDSTESNWLSCIVRKHRKAFHPVKHLLLIRFLCNNLEAFFGNEEKALPFGTGPWACFNGASKHYLERVITSVSVSYSTDAKKLIGTFSCSCGFVYSTSDTSVPYSNKLSFGKIKSFGKLWERKLKRLLVDQKVSLREAARQLKVDTQTVINHAERLKLIKSKKANPIVLEIDSEDAEKSKADSRSVWLKARKDYPKLSKTELRKKFPADFMRLYRSDRKWLERNSPKKKYVVNCNERVDWISRDQEVLVRAQNTVKHLQVQIPPIRITVGSVSKILGLRALLDKHLNKLPATKTFLFSQVESVEEFQLRRIYWAATELYSQNGFVKIWEIMRFAGIKSSCSNTIKQAIEHSVFNINSNTRFIRKTAV